MRGTRYAAPLEETALADPAVPRAELHDWARRYGVLAGITLRGRDFSLGLWTAEPAGQVLTRWRAFRVAVGNAFQQVVLGHQVHGDTVLWHEHRSGDWSIHEAADGHATALPGVLLAVTVADCVPVYLLHPETGSLALLHAGWRGTAADILGRGVDLVCRKSGAVPSDLVAHLGVAICGECYEVGPEVIEAVWGSASERPARLDLRAALADRADRLGLERLTTSPWCSAHDEAFFSHRRSGGADGRMVAYLGRPMA